MGTYDFRFTVFTPAYNRAYIIEKLYHSLQRQSFRDFEWLVVDDGSTDETEKLFERILAEDNPFPVRYVKTANGGKHRAINRGVAEARGELFFIVDSDDYLTDDALSQADRVEKSIPQSEKGRFAGICGRRGHEDGQPIGTTFAGEVLDITVLQRDENGITGDKSEIIYTDIMRAFPFPAFEGEKFLTECVVWERMAAAGYPLRFVQDVWIVCEYLGDGLTAQGNRHLFDCNPRGYGLYLNQTMEYRHWDRQERWETYLDYYYRFRDRFSMGEMARILGCSPAKFAAGIRIRQICMKLTERSE